MKPDRPLTLSLRTYEPRCTQSPWRYAGLILTAPLAIGATVFAAIGIGTHTLSPVIPNLAAGAAIVTAWIWTFSRHGPIARAGHLLAGRRVRRRPNDPWTADHRWDPRGAKRVRRPGMRPSGCIWLFVPWAIVLSLGWIPTAMIVVLALSFVAWICAPWLGFDDGRPFAAFVRFPYHPGEQVELHFGMGVGGPTFLRARFVLQRIREVDGWWFVGGPRRTVALAMECRPPEGVLPGSEADVRLLFDVPADAGGTSLSAPLPSYWELLVVGETTKGWFDETFLVPVYERPAASSAA